MSYERGQSRGHAEVTMVTVTYRAEDSLQWLQARSISRLVAAGTIERILVIDNGHPLLSKRQQSRLLSAYGPFADRVVIIPAAEVSQLPSSSGWMGQQVLKLGVSRLIETPWYVLLDAKNHVIRKIDASDLLAVDGKAHGGFHSYAEHPLLQRLHHTLDYLEVDRKAAEHFPPTSTPFVMRTDDAREVVDVVETSSGRQFAEEFVAADLSEFFLYSGAILRRDGSWEEHYDGEAIQSPTVWGGRAHVAGVREAIGLVASHDAPFFAVHRRALIRLEKSARDELVAFWVERGLFDSSREGRRFIGRFRREYAVSVARSRLRRTLTSR